MNDTTTMTRWQRTLAALDRAARRLPYPLDERMRAVLGRAWARTIRY